jgi:Fe(3+) dicitrate transport protein
VEVPGLEISATAQPESGAWAFPLQLSYTWMDAEFRTDFDSEFFGPVTAGDPVPYIPDHQLLASAGLANGPFSAYLSANYVDSICTQASCGPFERTESATLWDLAVHYRLNAAWELYAIAENLTDEIYIAGREPYGARPNKPQAYNLGVRFAF